MELPHLVNYIGRTDIQQPAIFLGKIMDARLCIMSLVLFSSTPTSVNAQVLPDSTDLKAAYCIPIARWASLTTVGEDTPEPFKTSLTAIRDQGAVNLRRLQLYLLPRIPQLETMSLVGAAKSAEEDMERLTVEGKKCLNLNTDDERLRCIGATTETAKRVRSCKELSFLPF